MHWKVYIIFVYEYYNIYRHIVPGFWLEQHVVFIILAWDADSKLLGWRV